MFKLTLPLGVAASCEREALIELNEPLIRRCGLSSFNDEGLALEVLGKFDPSLFDYLPWIPFVFPTAKWLSEFYRRLKELEKKVYAYSMVFGPFKAERCDEGTNLPSARMFLPDYSTPKDSSTP